MNEKEWSISFIRLVSMLMIIFCHILQGLNNRWAFWVNVGVQIFLFISGFLYGKKYINDSHKFYKKRLIKIFFPYLIILTIGLFLDIIIIKNSYSIKRILGCYIGLGAFGNNISILSHTWFVSYILLCYLMVPLLQNIFNFKKFNTNFIIFLLIMSILQFLQLYNIINIDVCWINNFIFGYFYGKCCKEARDFKKFNNFILLLFFTILPLAVIYQENIKIELPSILNEYSNMIINYGHVILGTAIFIVIYRICKYIKIKNNVILRFSDTYSYYIYLVHQIFILYTFSILFLTKYLFVNIILIFISSILSAIILKKLCDLLLFYIRKLLNFIKQSKREKYVCNSLNINS